MDSFLVLPVGQFTPQVDVLTVVPPVCIFMFTVLDLEHVLVLALASSVAT